MLTLDGLVVTEKSGVVTCTFTDIECVIVPLVPVIVTWYDTAGVFAGIVKVDAPEPVTVVGLSVAVNPSVAVLSSVTVSAKPPTDPTVMAAVPTLPS